MPGLLACLLLACRPATVVPGPEGRFAAVAAPYLATGTLTGLSIGYVEDGTVTYWHGGEATAGTGQPPGDSTLYALAGLTQLYTTALLADLSLSGEVDARDTADAYLRLGLDPGIRLWHLATHTAGLPATAGAPGVEPALAYRDFTTADLAVLAQTSAPALPPGSRYAYAPPGMVLLARALEASTGQSLAALWQDRLGRPLRWRDTRPLTAMTAGQFDRIAPGYSPEQERLLSFQYGAFTGAADLYSSLPEVMAFIAAQLDPLHVLHDALSLTQQPAFALGAGRAMGWGWRIREVAGARWLELSDANHHAAAIRMDPAAGRAVVVLSNTANLPAVEAVRAAIWDGM